MIKPGFKVLHVGDVDFRSHCWTLVTCLETVQTWLKAHPGHLPIYIQIENKESRPRPDYVQAEAITKATMDALDAEIRSVFSPGEVVTPDDVRGKFDSLEAAVLQSGWPKLDWARGKVVFLLDQERVTPLYTEGHPSLKSGMMFTNGKPGSPDAAFVKMNNPMSPEIPALVRKGYLCAHDDRWRRQGCTRGRYEAPRCSHRQRRADSQHRLSVQLESRRIRLQRDHARVHGTL